MSKDKDFPNNTDNDVIFTYEDEDEYDDEDVAELVNNVLKDYFVKDDPYINVSLNYLIKEEKRLSYLLFDDIRNLDLTGSIAYFEKEVPKIIKESESLCKKNNIQDYFVHQDGYDNYHSWDFSKSVIRLITFGETLLKLVNEGYYIPGTVGLVITLIKTDQWIAQYQDIYGNSELNRVTTKLDFFIREAFKKLNKLQDRNRVVRKFILGLMEWIVGQCKKIEDILKYMAILEYMIINTFYFYKLKKMILKLDQEFVKSKKISDEINRHSLILWWVELSLYLYEGGEAYLTAFSTKKIHPDVSDLFAVFYEAHEEWFIALKIMEHIIDVDKRSSKSNYKRIVKLAEKTEDLSLIQHWYEKMLLAFPDFNLFVKNLSYLQSDKEKAEKTEKWIKQIRNQNNHDLIIQIYLHLDQIENAWNEFIEYKQYFDMNDLIIRRLFKTMKKHDPNQLIHI